jgi:glycosyltransferase involved in cell wall biosynthesis
MNVETIQAFAAVARTHPDAMLVFVGPDLGLGETRTAAEELGILDRVRFFGPQPTADLLLEFAAAIDIGINLRQPPTNGETSAALLDLLRVGVPTVVTDVATFSDYPDSAVRKVRWEADGLDGLVRALHELLDDPEGRAALGRAARTHVREKHAWPLAAAGYRDVIDQCCAAASQRGRELFQGATPVSEALPV